MGDIQTRPVTNFRGIALPESAAPAGYAALVDHFELAVPQPAQLTAIAERHHPVSTDRWRMLTPRHAPAPTLSGHLEFALKWEGVDLAVLNALYRRVDSDEIAAIVRGTPTGSYARRLWFLFEWLTGNRLDVPDAGKVRAVNVLSPDQQFGLARGEAEIEPHSVADHIRREPVALIGYGLHGPPTVCQASRRRKPEWISSGAPHWRHVSVKLTAPIGGALRSRRKQALAVA